MNAENENEVRVGLRELRTPMNLSGARGLAMVLCFWASLAVSSSAEAEPVTEAASESTIGLLSYNVHGIFRWAAKDGPRDRMPTIGWLASRYDVVLVQEDFEFHDELVHQLSSSKDAQGNGMGWDPRRVLAKVFISPVSVLIPNFSPPYGAGIATFVRTPIGTGAVDRKAYGVCHGWFGANGDCWSNKGWLRVEMLTPEGVAIDVYNTHLEAGPSERSIEVRRQQLEILAEAIEELSADRPVIVAGDFNMSFGRHGDRELLMDFRERIGLRDSGAGPELPNWLERDYILYRGSDEIGLIIDEHGEAAEFVSRDRALSDHPALFIRFHVRSRTGAEDNVDGSRVMESR
jgi:Endonuclease/Exonuclease/phosphatase family